MKAMLFLLTLLAMTAQAKVVVNNASVKILPPGVPNTAAYLSIENTGDKPISLIGAQCACASRVEIHNHIMQDGLMKMVEQQGVLLKPSESVRFQPGGLHLMLFGTKKQLKQGQEVEITLLFDDKSKQKVKAKAVMPGEENTAGHHHHHH